VTVAGTVALVCLGFLLGIGKIDPATYGLGHLQPFYAPLGPSTILFEEDSSPSQNTGFNGRYPEAPPFAASTGLRTHEVPPIEHQGYVSEIDSIPPLEEFRQSVMGGNPEQLAGIWVEDVLAYRVQPGLTRIAPNAKDTLSIYKWAWEHGVTGLLIHNYRGGTKLYQLNPGIRIAAIYGNGGVDWYLSRGGTWYEARSKSSSGFAGPFRIWACDDCEYDISVEELHYRHYAGIPHLAFQTCVLAEGREGLMIVEAYLDWPDGVENNQNNTYGEDQNVWKLKEMFHESILLERMNELNR
jgi:hypothetical protein